MTDLESVPEQRSQNLKIIKFLKNFELLDKREFELTERRRQKASCSLAKPQS